MERALREAEKFFESLTREETKNLLEEAGFDVCDGSGRVNYLEDSFNFTIGGTFKTISTSFKAETLYSFPKAS